MQLGSLLTLRNGYNAASVAEQRRLALDLATRTGLTADVVVEVCGKYRHPRYQERVDRPLNERTIHQRTSACPPTSAAPA